MFWCSMYSCFSVLVPQQQAEVSVSRLSLLFVYAAVVCWCFGPEFEYKPSKNTHRMCDPTHLVFPKKL